MDVSLLYRKVNDAESEFCRLDLFFAWRFNYVEGSIDLYPNV